MTDFQDKKKRLDDRLEKIEAKKPKRKYKTKAEKKQTQKDRYKSRGFVADRLVIKDTFTASDLMQMSPEKAAKAINGITRGKDIFTR